MKVLIVEDDPAIRELVTMKLTRVGYEVLAESNGVAGLATALEQRPALVVLDWMMPGLSGVEVCSAMRADPRAEHIPVLLLTSRAQEADIDQGFAAGATDYMVKPFQGRELLSRVEALVTQKPRPTSTPGNRAANASTIRPSGSHR